MAGGAAARPRNTYMIHVDGRLHPPAPSHTRTTHQPRYFYRVARGSEMSINLKKIVNSLIISSIYAESNTEAISLFFFNLVSWLFSFVS